MPVVMASNFSFNALKTLNTALRKPMAMGHVWFVSWLTMQLPLTDCHNRFTVSLKQWKNSGDAYNLLVQLKQKNYQIAVLPIIVIIDHTSR